MDLVRAAALGGFFETLAELKASPDPLLRKAGLSRAMLADPEILLPAASVAELLEAAASATACPTFGLRMAERRNVADLGRISLLLIHQSTLRDALAVLAAYRHRINSTLALSIEEIDDIAIVREDFLLAGNHLARQADDLALAVLAGLCRSVSGADWRPLQVCFGYDAPEAGEREIYRRVFRCPVEFGSDINGIVIRAADLDQPAPRGDPALAAHASELIETVIDTRQRGIAEEVEQLALILLPSGRADIASCAASLGYNVRTLQRHLGHEGTSFSEILDRIRRAQLPRLFANRKLRLTDIAALLGYSSQGAFTRWHLSAFAEPPSAARKRAIHRKRQQPSSGALGMV